MQHIDTASPADIPQLCELLAILFAEEAEFIPDPARQAAALDAILARPETGCILVLRNGEILAGMVNLLYTISTACGGKAALLEDMVVRPALRGDGLGGRLLEAAITRAKLEGCQRITLLTDSTNHGAQRFYQRRGFTISGMLPLRRYWNRPPPVVVYMSSDKLATTDRGAPG